LLQFINRAFPVKTVDDDHQSSSKHQQVKIDVGASQILRSKGFFWLANDPTNMYIWSQAGGLFQLTRGGKWWVDLPIEDWPTDEDDIRSINGDFSGEHGDRR
jgi:G3E family GTPase